MGDSILAFVHTTTFYVRHVNCIYWYWILAFKRVLKPILGRYQGMTVPCNLSTFLNRILLTEWKEMFLSQRYLSIFRNLWWHSVKYLTPHLPSLCSIILNACCISFTWNAQDQKDFRNWSFSKFEILAQTIFRASLIRKFKIWADFLD